MDRAVRSPGPAPPARTRLPEPFFRLLSLAAFLPPILLAGCSRTPAPPGSPVVEVSVLPQADFVERIAGDAVTVQVMVPPGANPAVYEPTMEQLRSLSGAVLYVKVGHPGFPFERAWLDRLLAENPELPVVDASEGVDRREGDPHVWVSPRCVRVMARNIAAALAERFPENRARFEAGLDRFLREVDGVDRDLAGILGPLRGREFLVFHPAWGYLAAEYGLVQVAVEREHKEPGPKQLADLIAHVRASGMREMFVQPQISRQNADAVAAEMGVRVVVADPLARDWAANLRRVAGELRAALAGGE